MRGFRVVLFTCSLVLGSCSSDRGSPIGTGSSVGDVAASTEATSSTTTVDTTKADPTAARPFEVVVPKSYDASSAAALVLVLHGYTGSGASIRHYFMLDRIGEERGFLTVYPDGTQDTNGQRFWNATDACCNLGGATVDDSAYLDAVIDHVQKDYRVDPKRIYVVGHSNGGFMSYRMACEHADKIAAIVSLAGAAYNDAKACTPSEPVGVAQVHGTADSVISYGGGQIIGHDYPGAQATAAAWASYDDCGSPPRLDPVELDIEARIDGAETRVSAFPDCRPGGAVELWTIDGGSHSPALSPQFASSIVDFLFAHPKP